MEPATRQDRAEKGSADQKAAPGGPQIPSLVLPKGGGAIRGIGEKFAANAVTGTGSPMTGETP